MSHYNIGVEKHAITDERADLQMQGMADPSQQTTGVMSDIYARAYVIEDTANGKKVVIVIADIWSCAKLLKDNVLKYLAKANIKDIDKENLLIAGTHTHSAPGGYTGMVLYDQPAGKVDKITLDIYAKGIANSIKSAYQNRKKGKIYVNKGELENCGEQRSAPAYDNNPAKERSRYKSDTDKEMLLLKFVQVTGSTEVAVGALNWYAIHPTDLGQKNTLVSGDNKGYASQLFEEYAQETLSQNDFVAAFANSNCGDVSGNVSTGIPNGTNDEKHMKHHGRLQYEKALSLFDNAKTEVKGGLDIWYKQIDMSDIRIKNTQKRTFPPTLGLSFAAGSSEDSYPKFLNPITNKVERVEGVKEGLTMKDVRIGGGYDLTWSIMSLAMSIKFGTPTPLVVGPEITSGHFPKPILFAPINSNKLVPYVLPIQVLKIGDFAIAGIPGEINTMAGRRLRDRLNDALAEYGVNNVALGTYANDYSQYITTEEEYDMQHYEGASNLFGPHALEAYMQEFASMLEKEDLYVACRSDSLLDVWFYVSYKDRKGKKISLNSGETVKSHRFKLPWYATSIQVKAEYLPAFGKWTSSNVLKAVLKSGQTKKVLFQWEKLKFE